jgi:hypothetical protein
MQTKEKNNGISMLTSHQLDAVSGGVDVNGYVYCEYSDRSPGLYAGDTCPPTMGEIIREAIEEAKKKYGKE